jgi:hypothetical protein
VTMSLRFLKSIIARFFRWRPVDIEPLGATTNLRSELGLPDHSADTVGRATTGTQAIVTALTHQEIDARQRRRMLPRVLQAYYLPARMRRTGAAVARGVSKSKASGRRNARCGRCEPATGSLIPGLAQCRCPAASRFDFLRLPL